MLSYIALHAGRENSTWLVALPCKLPSAQPFKPLRRSFACYEQATEAPELPGQASREAPLQQCQRFTQVTLTDLSMGAHVVPVLHKTVRERLHACRSAVQ